MGPARARAKALSPVMHQQRRNLRQVHEYSLVFYAIDGPLGIAWVLDARRRELRGSDPELS